jgi:hypothetical protein
MFCYAVPHNALKCLLKFSFKRLVWKYSAAARNIDYTVDDMDDEEENKYGTKEEHVL